MAREIILTEHRSEVSNGDGALEILAASMGISVTALETLSLEVAADQGRRVTARYIQSLVPQRFRRSSHQE